jgi:arsenate reductase
MKTRIYHNPRCSKSRATLALLHERGLKPEIVEYLNSPLDVAALEALLGKLGLAARDIVRSGEAEFRQSGLDLDAPPDALLRLISEQPKILERPIVEIGDRARIGRPPERVLDIIE